MIARRDGRDFCLCQARNNDLIARRKHGFGDAEPDTPRPAGDQCLFHAATLAAR